MPETSSGVNGYFSNTVFYQLVRIFVVISEHIEYNNAQEDFQSNANQRIIMSKSKRSGMTVASLFCGAGGMDIGFEQAGFDVVWATDHNKDACETHGWWSEAEIVCSDVEDLKPSSMPDTDVIIGGFPCQGFSLAGNRDLDDSRNILYRHLVRCIGVKQPRAFVAENVPGLATIGGSSRAFKMILRDFENQGYDVTSGILDASRLGVPQERKRLIIVGIRKDIGREPTLPAHDNTVATMRDALWGMADPNSDDVFRGSFSSQFMSRNRWRGWDLPSYTVIAKPDKAPLHPSSPPMIQVSQEKWKFGKGDTRRVSWVEASLLQTFPKDMRFAGGLSSRYRQVGNAVPCAMARKIASNLLVDLNGKNLKASIFD